MHSPVPPPLPAFAQSGSVARTLAALPPGARPPQVWQGAALAILRLNPAECDQLGRVFEEETAADDRRLLVLDLLAGAGSFEAQAVLRRLLAHGVARRDRRMFVTFVQRLGLLDHPDGPTLRFLMNIFGESLIEAAEIRAACAYALGAAVGQAWRVGDRESAMRASDVLRRELRVSGAPLEKAALLTALGNAGIPSDLAIVMRYVQDAESRVRAAAALALRKLDVSEATAVLLGMLTDTSERVAHSALVALGEHRLEQAHLERLAELILSGRTARSLDERLLQLVVMQGGELHATPGRPSAIENALRLLLGRVEAAAGSGEHAVEPRHPRVTFTQSGASIPALPALGVSPLATSVASSSGYRIVRDIDTLEEARARVGSSGPTSPTRPSRPTRMGIGRPGSGTLAIAPCAVIPRSSGA